MLVVPGGSGQEALMEEEDVLGFIRALTAVAEYVFSIRTGLYSAALRAFCAGSGSPPIGLPFTCWDIARGVAVPQR